MRVWLASLVTTAAVIVAPVTAVTHWRPAMRPGPLFVGVTSARTCTGLLEIRYSTERLTSGAWEVVPDWWGADIQLHHIGTAAGPGGHWEPAPEPTRRGEGYVGAPVSGLPPWDLARVVMRADGKVIASSGRIPGGCAE